MKLLLSGYQGLADTFQINYPDSLLEWQIRAVAMMSIWVQLILPLLSVHSLVPCLTNLSDSFLEDTDGNFSHTELLL